MVLNWSFYFAERKVPMGLGITAPFGTARLREMAMAHFEGTVVKAKGKQLLPKTGHYPTLAR